MKYERNIPVTLSVREMPIQDRPREKMDEKGASALSDLELLMILLSSGSGVRKVNEIAADLLELLDCKPDPDIYEISQISGIGKAKASVISAALEIGRRRINRNGAVINCPRDIFMEVKHFANRQQEQMIIVVLNGAHEILNIFTATVGLVNRTLVHPREVFAEAISRRASAIAIAHNHPAGTTFPSEEDIKITQRIVKSGEILGIRVVDHIIFTTKDYYSFAEHSLL